MWYGRYGPEHGANRLYLGSQTADKSLWDEATGPSRASNVEFPDLRRWGLRYAWNYRHKVVVILMSVCPLALKCLEGEKFLARPLLSQVCFGVLHICRHTQSLPMSTSGRGTSCLAHGGRGPSAPHPLA